MSTATFPDLGPMDPISAREAAIREAEARLVGFALRDLGSMDHAPGLRPQHFGDHLLRAVFARLLAMRAAGAADVDPVALAAEMGGSVNPVELVQIEQQADGLTPSRAAGLASVVIEGWQARELRRVSPGFEDGPVGDRIEAARRQLDRIEAAAVSGRAVDPDELPLGICFADGLPDEYTPPDELIEGILTVGAGSVIYGDSNSGKTFLVIDMACAVARGVEWMGRQVEQGLVVYVAAESPASVKSRLQAYQLHHGVKVPNFAIVQAPVNLFNGDTDAELLIRAVKQVERMAGQPARLVIGDTLARLTAGGNENSGEDMGLVVQRFDRIRAATGAHFLLIHHSGKDAAKGARGHSSLRAAVDTEIEVQETPAGRCAEVMKQRDLGTKGERIGFHLEQVHVGVTKWGKSATTCVVQPTDAPEREAKRKRMGEVEGAVVEFLAQRKVGVRKAEVAKHFEGRYEKSNVFRAIRSLLTAQAIHEAAGMVCIAEAAK